MKNNFRIIKEMYNQLVYILNIQQKKACLLVFFASFISAILETMGISIILPFAQALVAPDELRKKWFLAPLANNINSDQVLIIVVVIAIIFIYLVKNLYMTWASFMQIKIRNCIRKDLSVKMLQSYMRHPYMFFVNTNSSVVLRGLTQDADGVYSIIECIFKLSTDVLTVILIAVFLCYTDFTLAIGILFISGICLVITTLGFKNKMSLLGKIQREMAAAQSKCAYQAIMGIKEILVMKRNMYFSEEYENIYSNRVNAETNREIINVLPERIIEFLCVSGILISVCVRASMEQNPVAFISVLAVFAVAAFRIMPTVARMIAHINCIVFLRPTLETTYNNIVEVDNFNESIEGNNGYRMAHKKIAFNDELFIEQVSWKYSENRLTVLNNLNLSIKKGEAVAFIGSSGAGKTTLADIILGLMEPKEGRVLCDGSDIYENLEDWSNIVGYVPQNVFLVDDTIINNIAFGISREKISEEKVWKALEQAQLREFVQNLPDGLNTIVGERGIKFSGGQRQRIAIARALYCDPEILVLDEATSALDTETENAVMESIESLQGKKTLIIVAHRLSTIKKCNKVYEIKEGKAFLKNIEEVVN